jgi:Uma2 family endonuclease
MRALFLDADDGNLAERSRLGLDHRDEMWEGVLHVVPPPDRRHQAIEAELMFALRASVHGRGWKITPETGVFASSTDYRIPDLVVYASEAASERGVDGAPEVVIEIRSPGDESDAKVPWYLDRGTKAVLIVDRDTLALDLQTPSGRGTGDAVLEPLGVRIASAGDTLTVDGVPLEI